MYHVFLVLHQSHMGYSSFRADQFIHSSSVTFNIATYSHINIGYLYLSVYALFTYPIHYMSVIYSCLTIVIESRLIKSNRLTGLLCIALLFSFPTRLSALLRPLLRATSTSFLWLPVLINECTKYTNSKFILISDVFYSIIL